MPTFGISQVNKRHRRIEEKQIHWHAYEGALDSNQKDVSVQAGSS
jgi:hypothetical protein